MVRISDIFKGRHGKTPAAPEEKHKESPSDKDKPSDQITQKAPACKPDSHLPEFALPKEEREDTDQLRIARAMQETAADMACSQNLYLTGIQLIKETLVNADQLKPINLVQIKKWISDMVDCIVFMDAELLRLFYEYVSEKYLYSHMVNTAIMATEIGLGLGYNKSQLNELGLAASLHDVGMIKVEQFHMQQRKLTEAEYNEIKNHPVYGADILSKIQGISEPVIYVVKEEHERMDGTGYPSGLKNKEISEYSRIVMITDVYEALTHDRPYHKKTAPHDAIKEMIANNPLFDSNILKVLINKVGMYPVSSWIELNTNEIGKVIINNSEFPLRPVVNILFDASGNTLKEHRVVNLSKQLNLFVKKSLSHDDLANRIKDETEI